jgi:hypothetical protein
LTKAAHWYILIDIVVLVRNNNNGAVRGAQSLQTGEDEIED